MPKCHYKCTEPECDRDCKAKCQSPKCETRCSEDADLHRCKMDCEEPSCAVVCPESGQSDLTQGFPSCTTECTKPQCKLLCPDQDCEEICEVPACQWDCDMSKCPKPDCKLECEEQTEYCSTQAEMPAAKPGTSVIRSFDTPLTNTTVKLLQSGSTGTVVETVPADVMVAEAVPGSSEVVLRHHTIHFQVA